MKSSVSLVITLIAICLAQVTWTATVCADQGERMTSIYVPPFNGPPGLSRSVNTILRLQIWQTLRKAAPGEETTSFGAGSVKWGPADLPSLTHGSAETLAHHARILSQIVLWGTVQEYGDGAVVQAFLSVPWYPKLNDRYFEDFRTERSEVWVVSIPLDNEVIEFRQDIPRRRLAFEPVILTKEVIDKYSDLDAIVMYDRNQPDEPIGKVGNIIDAVVQYGDKALVTSGGKTGLVLLPELSEHRSEVVDFASGLMRVFRQDWAGAETLFFNVINNERAPTELRIDACLYRAMASASRGFSGAEDIDKARALNPYAVRVYRFAIMERLAQLGRAIGRGATLAERQEIIAVTEKLVSDARPLFLRKDPWLDHIDESLERIAQAE